LFRPQRLSLPILPRHPPSGAHSAAPIVIEGGDERAKGEVTLKDMALGAELSSEIKNRAE
jgi:hypothetical protein